LLLVHAAVGSAPFVMTSSTSTADATALEAAAGGTAVLEHSSIYLLHTQDAGLAHISNPSVAAVAAEHQVGVSKQGSLLAVLPMELKTPAFMQPTCR
jgi:hypothetical protein